MRLGFFILLLSFLGIGSFAHAQFSGDLLNQDVQIVLDPQYPTPGETVTASIDDYSLGITGTAIDWSIDDVQYPQLQNQRSVSFTAGKAGMRQTISAVLRFPNGGQMNVKNTFIPFYTDVIVEPQTYSPNFYKGRALPSFGSPVVLTALIHDQNGPVDAASLTYSWFLNDTAINGGPIRGGYKTKMTVPYGRNSIVTLGVTNSDGTTIARRLIQIPSVEVDVQFYEVSTLFGLSKKAISDKIQLIGNSTTVRAVPYNLDRNSVNGDLFTEWKIDGQKQEVSDYDPFEVTLLRQGIGSSQINFKIRNLSALIQSDERSFTVQY